MDSLVQITLFCQSDETETNFTLGSEVIEVSPTEIIKCLETDCLKQGTLDLDEDTLSDIILYCNSTDNTMTKAAEAEAELESLSAESSASEDEMVLIPITQNQIMTRTKCGRNVMLPKRLRDS